jgi:hypothetical protein
MSYIINPNFTKENTQFMYRGWYHENIQARDILLIVAGDSWTWGDSLHGIDATQGIHDDPQRLTSVYGHLLAEKINADFVNIARCGGSNFEMYSNVLNILLYATQQYKKIYVVITLTENFREAFDPTRFDNIQKVSTMWIPNITDVNCLDDFAEKYEKLMFESIKNNLISKYPDIVFLIGRNFTYSFDENKPILKSNLLEKTWIDCLVEYQQKFNYPKLLRVLSGMAFNPLTITLEKLNLDSRFQNELINYFDLANQAIDWLLTSDLNHKKASKHPTELGHKIWSDYLYTKIIN